MRILITFIIILLSFTAVSQEKSSNYKLKKFAVKDSILIDSVSINPSLFKVKKKSGELIDSSLYTIDFSKSILKFKPSVNTDTILVEYLRYPNFITKTYRQLDDNIIVQNTEARQKLFQIQNRKPKSNFTPFDGLTTSGSISRGVTIGNNQNSVLNSELDLQISGKLSDKVSLRASIQDANIPLQESGFSQRLDEFDQIFIELFSKDWRIRAGDIDLENNTSYYNSFSKRVQGLFVNASLSDKTSVFASGALVRGQFTTSQFTAQEGNQGPYKLRGPNNELFVLVVSGSETVYVNGVPLERGENKDYIIDYNAGQIVFNSTFPITSEMRITVDYQFSERNYSRFTVYGGSQFETEKLKLNLSVYSESDAKNQPLQQNLSTEQAQILAAAGDDMSLMTAPSAVEEIFSENRILYRKELFGTEEIFVFSNDPNDQLFSVRFTLVGNNLGNYVLSNDSTIANIYEFVPPIAGIPQGNFEPIIQLVAPERLQIATLNGTYTPTEKTNVFFELAGSKNDLNLFSSADDNNNDGFAGKFKVQQKLIKKDSAWNVSAIADVDYLQDNFRTVQRLYRPEFARDWNLDNSEANQGNVSLGDQLLFNSGVQAFHYKKGRLAYNFEHLNYSEAFNGNRHNLRADLRLGDFSIFSQSSALTNNSSLNTSNFVRSFNRVVYGKTNKWAGAKLALEDNKQTEKATGNLTALSQKFTSYEAFAGVGDSTKVFVELGYIHRLNDSLRNNNLQRVNTSNTYYLKSRLIQNKTSNLQLFVNYRTLKAEGNTSQDEQSLNSRLNYNQRLFKNVLILNTSYETNSGTLPQQDFTFVEVEPGQGNFTWIDYNDNGVQELGEFETAKFADQGSYIRVLLPNQVFIQTHQNRFSQTVTFNPQQWNVSENKQKKFWSHFYNQTSFLVDNKLRRSGSSFNLNPFEALNDENDNDSNRLGLNFSLRNVLFYNRGKQRYTTSYTYLTNKSQSLLSIGAQQNKIRSHQVNFNHKFLKSWLVTTEASLTNNESFNESFVNRDFKIDETQFQPKLSYIFNENAQFDVFYQYTNKKNTIGNSEELLQNNYGFSFTYNNAQKVALTGEFNYFQNDYLGNANTPVAFQILEGLQPGKNFTWSVIAQKKLTKFLDLNLNYFGRKTETSKTIHTGTVQLKAYF
ncbi:hypothetical protein BTO05_10150 [Winogradskyella sp. PC-19]|uniref:hypothetical protein n=1 Tax=unclassified Winogradskyella TaxID=2615021 RepID=UPI000B3D32FE|nr:MULTISPECIES: hypothetical protein [unclassified Winogradskyella]ARV09980.1 hypothetical protein BTO05_10150 [Winogradskyella sp. PC-19]RZN79947.1 MAG: hypothetical protein EVB12_04435 [Winogradskyella sp.]